MSGQLTPLTEGSSLQLEDAEEEDIKRVKVLQFQQPPLVEQILDFKQSCHHQ